MVTSEQRRRQLAREKYLRQQERRASRRRRARVRNIGLAVVAALVIAAGVAYAESGGLNGDKKKETAQNKADKASKTPDPCRKPAGGKPNGKTWKKEPALDVDESATYKMTLETTCGDIAFAMDASKTPHTVNTLRFLSGERFFDHTKCHRLVDQSIHVLQCGDPKATGQGGPGYTIPDENLKDSRLKGGRYPAATVAMANRYNPQTKKGRDTGGSQFFLVFKDSDLPADYTPVGKITKGMSVLKKIAKAGSTPDPQTQNTPPNATVVIDRATVSKS